VDTRGGNRMRESCTYGSVRGVRGNSHPYRAVWVLLHLLTAGFGTELPNRDVCIHGESWRVSGLCLDMRILMAPFRLGNGTAVTCEVVRESGTNGARILRLT